MVPIPLVSTSAYVNPIAAIVLGNLIAAEPLSPQPMITTKMIINAVVLISIEPRSGKRQDTEPIAMDTRVG